MLAARPALALTCYGMSLSCVGAAIKVAGDARDQPDDLLGADVEAPQPPSHQAFSISTHTMRVLEPKNTRRRLNNQKNIQN